MGGPLCIITLPTGRTISHLRETLSSTRLRWIAWQQSSQCKTRELMTSIIAGRPAMQNTPENLQTVSKHGHPPLDSNSSHYSVFEGDESQTRPKMSSIIGKFRA